MAEYPAELVHKHRLADGRTVTIRPIRPDDRARVRALLSASSEETRYQRFQKWVHAPSDKLIHFLTTSITSGIWHSCAPSQTEVARKW